MTHPDDVEAVARALIAGISQQMDGQMKGGVWRLSDEGTTIFSLKGDPLAEAAIATLIARGWRKVECL